MAVPCKLHTQVKKHFVQTYVIKFARDASPAAVETWAQGQGIHGAGAYALVRIPVTEELYLVLTLGEAYTFKER
eukprot:9723895-Karenia_brevis.AAC.1